MKINYSNAQIINNKDFYIHDDWFVKMSYEYDESCNGLINLHLKKYCNTKNDYCIKFINVIGFESISCTFWGKSINIYDIEYIDNNEQVLLPKLYNEMKKQSSIDKDCKLISDTKYMEISIYLISGDKLTIACETIDVDDKMIKCIR